MYQLLADGILLLHTLIVVFIVLGELLILTGGIRGWLWVRHWWFRVVHVVCIAIVVAQSWLGVICPLTLLEMKLRLQEGRGYYESSFIQYWLQRLLYYDAPQWVFVVVYTAFGTLVLYTWVRYPPVKS